MQRVILFLGLVASILSACREPIEVSTLTVTRGEFVHRVGAEGFLRASTVTQVVVPSEVRHAARILWMAADGVEVEAGDVVLQLDQYLLE